MSTAITVTAVTGSTTVTLQGTGTAAVRVGDGKICRAKNSIDSLSFTLYPIYGTNGNGFPSLSPLKTIVTVADGTETLFLGRVLNVTAEMTQAGELTQKVVCEGELAFLCDSVQPYLKPKLWEDDSTATGLQKYVDAILANHNAQVESSKQIQRGTVNVSTYLSSNNVYKGMSWENTWTLIREKLLDVYGGEIRIRHEASGLYLDYQASFGSTHTGGITLADNMVSASKKLESTDVVTRLVPLGARLVGTGTESEQSYERLTIKSVNSDCAWLEDSTAVAQYGYQYKVVVWDDVTVASTLKTRAQTYLAAQNQELNSYNVVAVDTSYTASGDRLQLYDRYPVSNTAIGISETLEVQGITIYLDRPHLPDVTFGLEASASQTTGTALEDMDEIKESVSELTLDWNRIELRVEDSEEDIAALEVTATSLTTRVSTAEGDISTLEQTATSLAARVTSAEGDISALELTVSGFSLSYTSGTKKIKLLSSGVEQGSITLTNLVDDDTLDDYYTAAEVESAITSDINGITISYSANLKKVSLSNGNSTGTMDVVDESTVESLIDTGINGISLTVNNGSYFSNINLKYDGITISSGTVQFNGDIIFASDLTDGTTQISGNNILTGTIKADYIHLYDSMTVYSGSTGSTVGGYFGYTTSNVDGSYGVALKSSTSNRGECIATNLGARISYNGTASQFFAISSYAGVQAPYFRIEANMGTSYTGVYYFRYWTLCPDADNEKALGASTNRWSVVYAGTSSITTSDRTQKIGISYDLSGYDTLFDALRPASFLFVDGTSRRTHTGLIAQDVETALTESGMTALDFAGFCRDDTETGTQYGLRYEEFIALCIRQIQTLKARVTALEAMV